MKRPIFTLLVILVLAMAGSLAAQSYDQPTTPSQQVDQSGQPEQPGSPDVDVDVGENAAGGVDVDVDAQGDADTEARDETMTADTTDTAADADALPGTASETPLIGLLGLLALAGGVALRASR